MRHVNCWVAIVALFLAAGCREKPGKAKTDPGRRVGVFTRRPAVSLQGRRATVEFGLARKIDLAVRVKDRDGRTVRHLAAGVPGDRAPAPLAAGSLDQKLVWDGRDDDGMEVPAGRYTIEVAAGLAPRFDRLFLDEPLAVGAVHGLAVGPRGDLYVMGGSGRVTSRPRFLILDSRGRYRRTIVPRPAGLPLERVKPLGEFVLESGERFPLCLLPQYGGPLNQVPAVAPNGDLIFANGHMMKHAERHRFRALDRLDPRWPRRLLRLAADGGAPEAGYLGPVLGKAFAKKTLYLATSPDGKTVYVSGARHAVFRASWGAGEKPAAFIGTPDRAGKGAAGLKDPCGIAVDDRGRVYVADRGNHRIACFDPEGKLLGAVPVEWPRHLAVTPDGGAIYAARGFKRCELVKFAGMKAAAPVARLPLASGWPVLALDGRGARPVIYVGNQPLRAGAGGRSGTAVARVRDTGRELRHDGSLTRGAPGKSYPLLLGADRERGWVYGVSRKSYFRMREDSGRLEPVPMRQHPKSNNSSDLAPSVDGEVGILVSGEIGLLDEHLLPVPFAASNSFITRLLDKGGGFAGRGFYITPGGEIYRHHEPGGHGKPMRVTVMGRDGRTVDYTRVLMETGSSAGIRVDRAGNIYVLDHLKSVGNPVPRVFAGKVKVDRHHPFVYHYGSLLKFRPEGGRVKEMGRKAPADRLLKVGQRQFTTAEGRGDYVAEGLLWSWYGVSMITPALDRGRYAPYNCMCLTPEFDLDGFARVFVPDQLRCRIVVLDSAGNFITAFGRYDNLDARGPEITFSDPRSVMVSGDAAFVGDARCSRIVKVRLDYRRRASCRVRLPAPVGPPPDAVLVVRRLREEVSRMSPTLAGEFDWKALTRRIARRSKGKSLDDARAELCRAAPRELRGWPEPESRALLGYYLKNGGEGVRAAVVWGLAGDRLGEAGSELLREALGDKSQMVRVAAAYVLLDRRDPSGLSEIFDGALAKNRDAYKLSETAILRQLLVWRSSDPRARTLDTRNCLVPEYKPDRKAVAALGRLLEKSRAWYLRRAALFLLGFSGSPEAAKPLLRALRKPERNRNLNRCIGGLGLLRCQEAVPDLVKYLARGRAANYGTQAYDGDEAEVYASRALVRIADPKCVGPVIALLDSGKPEVRTLSRRTLTELFSAKVPADRVLVPKGGELVRVRVDQLPAPAKLRAAWEAFWKANAEGYSWQKKEGPLRSRQETR